jgi:hypothetical protein
VALRVCQLALVQHLGRAAASTLHYDGASLVCCDQTYIYNVLKGRVQTPPLSRPLGIMDVCAID